MKGGIIIKNTKEQIWKEALNLFSKYGYEGVSVKEIAKAVGIKDSSIYNHYKSKQEIFDTILKQVSERMEKASSTYTFPISTNTVENYKNVSLQDLSSMCFDLFNYYLNDNLASKFRKMLIIEQYSNNKASKLFNEIFIDDVLKYESSLFNSLIESGKFIKTDPYIMALHFYSPLFLLLFKYDSASIELQPLKEIINRHVEVFAKIYANGDKN